jgi:hypothetical protein
MKTKKETCESCCIELDPSKGETITCNICEADKLRSLLNSKRWMEIRGPFMADEIRADLARIEAIEN